MDTNFNDIRFIYLPPMLCASIQLGISTNMETMTANYVDVRLERKQIVLEAYHNALHPQAVVRSNQQATK